MPRTQIETHKGDKALSVAGCAGKGKAPIGKGKAPAPVVTKG